MKNKIMKFYSKNQPKITKILSLVMIISAATVMSTMGVSASIFGNAPAGTDTSKIQTLIAIIFWLVRIIIASAGLIPSIIKIVQGQSDENPRDRNSGIASAVVAAAAIGVSFVLEKWF
jgi:hypothetical protein